ncbi:PASTA domain-containing protein [Desulfolithobacter dissulfuricans]|uniref:PASTA domain-containing protein n=1 Tax=Desulfolithobacter dissulfuricans TaxID=2795293 RepID=UPI00227987FF|nr:PASTA domain-containing protein [Desulfolithobacter dissulfuricans]
MVGFSGDGVGLAGAESIYDILLQPGELQAADVPEIDFGGQESFGGRGMDVVLSLDLELQKKIEQELGRMLEQQAADRGMALAMEVRTGRILAMVSLPSFNPNHFWQADDPARRNQVVSEPLAEDLVRPLLARAGAISSQGPFGPPLPPEAVAAPDLGLTAGDVAEAGARFGLRNPLPGRSSVCDTPSVFDTLPSVAVVGAAGQNNVAGQGITLLKVAAAASMINGGRRVEPVFLEAVYDRATGRTYTRSESYDRKKRRQVVDPVLALRLRRELLSTMQGSGTMAVYSRSGRRTEVKDQTRITVLQDLVLGVTPRKNPQVLLLLVTSRDSYYPLPGEVDTRARSLADLGMELLPDILESSSQTLVADHPAGRDEANYKRFLIASHIEYREEKKKYAPLPREAMPEVVGLSLRKGLQRLDGKKILVRIQGSGRIVGQRPGPGEPLAAGQECVLTLEPVI